jgi:membrane protease YdiL (CAAX protease family)
MPTRAENLGCGERTVGCRRAGAEVFRGPVTPSISALCREMGRFLLALGLAFLIVTALALAFTPWVEEPSRWARKPLLFLVIGIWIALWRPTRGTLAALAGWAPAGGRWRIAVRGFLVGMSALVLLNVVLLALGAREVEWDLSPGQFALRVVLYLLQAIVLALVEESFFRGILQNRLRAAGGTTVAVLLGSVIFALAHFLRPPKHRPPEAWWDTVPACLAGVGEVFGHRWTEGVGLFLVGLVLAMLRVRSPTIFLAVGVHAGWVFVRFVSRKVLDEVDGFMPDDPWLLGSMRIYDGVVGWGALLLTLVIAWRPNRGPADGSIRKGP